MSRMRHRCTRLAFAAFALGAIVLSTHVHAEVDEVTLAKQFGIGSLTFIVMEHQKLYEKALAAANVGHPVAVRWVKFTGGAAMNDAILSGHLSFALAGVGPLATMWAKTRDNIKVMGVCAANSMPMLLNTRDPKVKTIADFTDRNKIALPGVKVSIQAILLEMAAAKAFGDDQFGKLDALTVTRSHADGMAEMLSPVSQIDSHFTSPPYSYEELDRPGIHTVLDSYRILGGPGTLNTVYATSRFRDENPKVYAAFLEAFRQATDFINQNKPEAARIYIEVSKDKSATPEELVKMLENPDIRYTMVPQGTMKVVSFMYKQGRIKVEPKAWSDLFFPEVHHLPGN
jgi:NitT/TauT family transport system substrate-binding protein